MRDVEPVVPPLSNAAFARQVLFIAALWGTAFAFIRIAAVGGMSPFALAASRGAIAALAIGIWFLATRRVIATDRLTLRHMIILGIFNGFLPNVLLVIALSRIESAPAAMIQAMIPILVIITAPFILAGERFGTRQLAGTLLAFLGVFILVGPSAVIGGRATLIGALAMMGVAATYAASAIYIRRTKPSDLVSAAFGQQVVATSAALILTLVFESHQSWQHAPDVWGAVAGVAIISTAIPMVMYFRLLTLVPAAKAALVQYLIPVSASIYAVLLLGERLRAEVLIGGMAVLLGVWIAARTTPVGSNRKVESA
jgi:drug/metabolite transporter (DMT)-like permease